MCMYTIVYTMYFCFVLFEQYGKVKTPRELLLQLQYKHGHNVMHTIHKVIHKVARVILVSFADMS